MDFVNDDGNIETLRKDKFADQYTTPEAEAKRKDNPSFFQSEIIGYQK